MKFGYPPCDEFFIDLQRMAETARRIGSYRHVELSLFATDSVRAPRPRTSDPRRHVFFSSPVHRDRIAFRAGLFEALFPPVSPGLGDSAASADIGFAELRSQLTYRPRLAAVQSCDDARLFLAFIARPGASIRRCRSAYRAQCRSVFDARPS